MIDDPEIQKIIRVETLLNAKIHSGSPNAKAIMGKILGRHAKLRPFAKDLNIAIADVVKDISSISMNDIQSELSEIAPDAVSEVIKVKKNKAKVRKEKKKELEEIPTAVKGAFTVRYAPDPSKYPHIGQGMNFLINRMYADKYDGKVVLRFDDTNPTMVKKKYFEVIREGLLWLGCTWDEEIRASSFLEEFYTVTKEWIGKSWMYVCLCSGEDLSSLREHGISCEHRDQDIDLSLRLFDNMLNGDYKAGEAIVRLVGDMSSDNNVMRDPIMLRVVNDKHVLLDRFYPVFPTYDFESSYLDWKMGVTHIIRSGEFGTMRQELQVFIIIKLGGKRPEFKSFGRFNIQGTPTKGRVIRELVETNVVSGWDDIRLITLAGLKKRGVHPHTPRLLIHEAGLTPKNTNIAWSTFEKKSKELLEPTAKRLFFVEDPIRLKVANGNRSEVNLPFHPDKKKMGMRMLKVSDEIFVSSKDMSPLKKGDIFRLKDLFNVKIVRISKKSMQVEYAGDEIDRKMSKIQWVSDGIKGKLLVPEMLEKSRGEINPDSLPVISGLFERNILDIGEDEVIQLERVGYAKVRQVNKMIEGHIVHR